MDSNINLITSYQKASGSSIDKCFLLARRYNKAQGYKPLQSESWLLSQQPSSKRNVRIDAIFGTIGWLSDLWTSPSGEAFVCEATNSKLLNFSITDHDNISFRETRFSKPITGVWGLHDQCIFTWGTSWNGINVLYKFNGERWQEIFCPRFQIHAMHGVDESCIWAVGNSGIAMWDGSKWDYIKTSNSDFTSVAVSITGKIYATTAQGIFHWIAGKEFNSCLETACYSSPYLDVVEWNNTIWLAGGVRGLFMLDAKFQSIEVKKNIAAIKFDAQKELLITCRHEIVGTADGKQFYSVDDQNYLLNHRSKCRLGAFESNYR